MMSRSLFGSLATALALATPLASQEPIDGRLAGRVSPAVVAVVRELAPAAAARGLPIDPLIQKAIEGSAKGVPADLVAAAASRARLRRSKGDAAAAEARHPDGVDPRIRPRIHIPERLLR